MRRGGAGAGQPRQTDRAQGLARQARQACGAPNPQPRPRAQPDAYPCRYRYCYRYRCPYLYPYPYPYPFPFTPTLPLPLYLNPTPCLPLYPYPYPFPFIPTLPLPQPSPQPLSPSRQGGCPKTKDCWGADAAEAECIACIESEQEEYIGSLDTAADDEDAELQRELEAAVAAGALPEDAVLAPKTQQQPQQQQAFPDLEMPKRSQQQQAALEEFEKRQRQAQQAEQGAAQPVAAAQPAAHPVLQPPTLTGAAAGEDGAAEAAAAAAGAAAGAAGGADMVLPPGTCKATNPAYAASQEQWARWCATT